MTARRRVVFLDRDGVLGVPEDRDGKGYAVRRVSDRRTYSDVVAALGRLKKAGYDLVVVTNQPDVAFGLLDSREFSRMHARLLDELPLDRILVCRHDHSVACDCRKPRPGLRLANDGLCPVDYAASWMVGDRDSDGAAGQVAGCRTVFIDRGWRDGSGVGADFVSDSLATAVDAILSGC